MELVLSTDRIKRKKPYCNILTLHHIQDIKILSMNTRKEHEIKLITKSVMLSAINGVANVHVRNITKTTVMILVSKTTFITKIVARNICDE
jgi:hypothetical protein